MSAPRTTAGVSTSAGTRSEPITAPVIRVSNLFSGLRLRANHSRLLQDQFYFRLCPPRQPARLQGGRLQARGHRRPGRADEPALSRLLPGQEGERDNEFGREFPIVLTYYLTAPCSRTACGCSRPRPATGSSWFSQSSRWNRTRYVLPSLNDHQDSTRTWKRK